MREPIELHSGAEIGAWAAFNRALPTGLALIPICILLGVLAANANWSVLDVLLFSALGFSGSGQFALLPLAEQGIGFLTMLVVTMSINIRAPIAFSSASRLPHESVQRAFTAHILGDEAYALEQEHDTLITVFVTRLTIYGIWVASTVVGALTASFVPHTWLLSSGVNLGFPASAVLLVLCFSQLKLRVPQISASWRRRFLELALCIGVALLLLIMLGKTWFWLPSLMFSAWRLWKIPT